VKPSETAGRLICRKVLGDHSAVRDRFNAGVELNADPVSQRERHLSYRRKMLHRHHLVRSVDRLTAEDHRREAAI
jgi:hypothetical protein